MALAGRLLPAAYPVRSGTIIPWDCRRPQGKGSAVLLADPKRNFVPPWPPRARSLEKATRRYPSYRPAAGLASSGFGEGDTVVGATGTAKESPLGGPGSFRACSAHRSAAPEAGGGRRPLFWPSAASSTGHRAGRTGPGSPASFLGVRQVRIELIEQVGQLLRRVRGQRFGGAQCARPSTSSTGTVGGGFIPGLAARRSSPSRWIGRTPGTAARRRGWGPDVPARVQILEFPLKLRGDRVETLRRRQDRAARDLRWAGRFCRPGSWECAFDRRPRGLPRRGRPPAGERVQEVPRLTGNDELALR